MKTLFAVALATSLSFSAFASDAREDLRTLSTVKTNYKMINVTLKEGVGNAKIEILDEEGHKLSQRNVTVKDESLMVPYNLEQLPDGEYRVKIVTDMEEVTYSVYTVGKPLPVDRLPLSAYGKAIDKNTMRLTVIGLLEPGVNVQVFTSNTGALIYEEDISQAEGFTKNFKFEGMNLDDIYMIVKDAKGRSKKLFF